VQAGDQALAARGRLDGDDVDPGVIDGDRRYGQRPLCDQLTRVGSNDPNAKNPARIGHD